MIKRISAVSIAVLLLIIINCSLKEPVLPSWFVTLNIPLSEETFNLGEEFVNGSTVFLQPDTNTTANNDSLIAMSINSDVDTTRISRQDLSLEPQNDSISIGLGLIEQLISDSLTILRTEIKLDSLFPELQAGDTVTIFESTLNSLTVPFTIEAFNGIHINSGIVTLSVENNLPFPIGPNNFTPNGIEFNIIDDSLDQNIVGLSIPDTIPSGGTDGANDQIGPVWIYSKVRVDYILPISQTTTFLVTDSLLKTSGLTIELELENLEVDSAYAKLKKFEESSLIKLESKNKIRRAEIESGRVELNINNHLQLGANIRFSLPNIKTEEGNTLLDSIIVQRDQPKIYQHSLSNHAILNPSNPNNYVEDLLVNFSITYLNVGEFALITNNDSVFINVNTDTTYLKYFSGFFALDSLTIPEFSEGNLINYGKFEPGVLFQNAELTLNLTSELTIENLILDLNIEGYHYNDNGVITHTASLNPPPQTISTNGSPGNEDNVVISISGTDVANFLNILPNALKSFGKVSINGEAEIFQNSEIWGGYSLATPLRLEVKNLPPIHGEVVTIIAENDDFPYEGLKDTLAQDIIDKKEDLQGGSLELELINHTPAGVTISMLVSSDLTRPDSAFYDTTNIIDSLEFIKSASVSAAETDPQTGYVTTARKSIVSLNLTKNQIQMLTQPPYKVGYILKVSDSGGTVIFRPVDFVKSFGLAKLIVRVEDD